LIDAGLVGALKFETQSRQALDVACVLRGNNFVQADALVLNVWHFPLCKIYFFVHDLPHLRFIQLKKMATFFLKISKKSDFQTNFFAGTYFST
jgi:hypothetical protein